jgi:hypothetical protein
LNLSLRKFIIAASILFLALLGGMQFYVKPWGICFVLGMMIVVAFGLLIKPPLNPPQEGGSGPVGGAFFIFLPIFAAILISNAANRDIFPATFSRTLLFSAFLVAILGAHELLSRSDVFSGLYLAGALWPGVWLIALQFGWRDNTNIIAAWSVIFVATSLAGRNWWVLLVHTVILIWLNSQGATLGAIVAAGVMICPYLRFNPKILTLVGLGVMAGLIAWNPFSVQIRLSYWQQAWFAFLTSPIFGVGPGGLSARNIIRGWGGGLHAHNILASTAAELGLVGLAAVTIMIWLIARFRWEMSRWQFAAVAGILAHSMVDEPLWWPGPLLAFAMVIGSLKMLPNRKNRV